MGMPVADVDRASLGWYLLETSAGRAAMARGALLVALMFVLGWHRRRGKVETAFPLAATLAGGALASLAWNGHAAAGEGVDRKSVVEGKRVSVRVYLGGRRLIKTKT